METHIEYEEDEEYYDKSDDEEEKENVVYNEADFSEWNMSVWDPNNPNSNKTYEEFYGIPSNSYDYEITKWSPNGTKYDEFELKSRTPEELKKYLYFYPNGKAIKSSNETLKEFHKKFASKLTFDFQSKCQYKNDFKNKKYIGFKLLRKMGYQPGKGLGKNLHGISEPIKIFLRVGRSGLGSSHGCNEIRTRVKGWPPKIKSKVNINNNSFGYNEKKMKDNIELLSEYNDSLSTNIFSYNLLDKTSSKPPVFNNYMTSNECNMQSDQNLYLNDINTILTLHQLQNEIDKIENNLLKDDSNFESLEEHIESLRIQEKPRDDVSNEQSLPTTENNLTEINNLIDKSNDTTSKEVAEAFKILYNHTEYDQFLWNIWMLHFQNIIQGWDCRHPENLVSMLEACKPLLPLWISNNLLDTVIIPKLISEVEKWNPLCETQPIHLWLQPWLLLIKNQMNTLIYPIILKKLSIALETWHPMDITAWLTLQPWKNIFSKKDMDDFLIQNILPKLQLVFSELIISPGQQDLEPWHWVYVWKDLIPHMMMVKLLNEFFFPKWFKCLSLQLNHSLNSTKNFEEVTNWCNYWKTIFSKKLFKEPVIKKNFQQAFNLIDVCMQLSQGIEPTFEKSVSSKKYQSKIEQLVNETVSNLSGSFKDLVLNKCQERGILFMPLAHRYYDGKQIFKLGSDQVYIDCNTLFIRHDETWIPTDLNSIFYTARMC